MPLVNDSQTQGNKVINILVTSKTDLVKTIEKGPPKQKLKEKLSYLVIIKYD